MENRVSIESPVGRALKGHKVGDRVQVKVNETMSYYLKIRSIDKTGDEAGNRPGDLGNFQCMGQTCPVMVTLSLIHI